MKWFEKNKVRKPSPNDGDMRIIKKFLWFPLKINKETRWLEFVKIRQKFYETESRPTGGYDFFGSPAYYFGDSWWSNQEFIND